MVTSDDSFPEEVSRRRFMANATLGIGGVIGLGLAIPLLGSLKPDTRMGSETWTMLDQAGWKDLQSATDGAVQMDFQTTWLSSLRRN